MANGSSNIPLDTIVTAVIARLFKRVLTGVVGLAVAVGGGGWYGTWNWVQKYVDDQFSGATAGCRPRLAANAFWATRIMAYLSTGRRSSTHSKSPDTRRRRRRSPTTGLQTQ